jgi:hypothetical protein
LVTIKFAGDAQVLARIISTYLACNSFNLLKLVDQIVVENKNDAMANVCFKPDWSWADDEAAFVAVEVAGIETVVLVFNRTEDDVFVLLVVGALVLQWLDCPFGYEISRLV